MVFKRKIYSALYGRAFVDKAFIPTTEGSV